MIKNIIFDFGRVLVDWIQHYLYDPYFGSKEKTDWFIQHICTIEWNNQTDVGKTFAQAIAEKTAEFPEWEKEIRMYGDQWIQMIGDPIPGMYEWILRLKQDGYSIYGLTNWSTETFPLVRHRFPVFDLLDGIVMSGEEKIAKPDHRIYHILLSRYQLSPHECVFIDDNAHNIAAAQALGIHGIQFFSAEQAQQAFHALEHA